MIINRLSLDKIAIALLIISAFFITLWRFGANQCLILSALAALLHRPWRRELFSGYWLKIPAIWSGIIFLIWIFFSMSYSHAPDILKVLEGVAKYSKLLFLLFFPLMLRQQKNRLKLENAFIYGALINVITSTLYYFHVPFVVNELKYFFSMPTFSINPLQLIYIVVMASWFLTVRLLHRENHKKLDLAILLVFVVYLWFINLERSGYLLFLALALFLVGQRYGRKAFLLGCIMVPILFAGLYELSPNVKNRADLAAYNLINFEQASNSTDVGLDNSWGLRLAFAEESYRLIKTKPALGWGIGSFKYLYDEYYPQQSSYIQINDPHDAYVYVAFELGVIGLILYCTWLYAVYRLARQLNLKDQTSLMGGLIMFIIMGFTDSGLPLNSIGISFIIWVSMYSNIKLLNQNYEKAI